MAEFPTPATGGGELRVQPRVVERIAAYVTGTVTGVAPERRRPRTQAHLIGRERVALTVDIAVLWPSPAADVAATVQAEVSRTVDELTPFTTDRVDVRVRSLVTASGPERVQ